MYRFIYGVVKKLMPVVSRLAGCFKRLDHGSSMRLPVMTRFWGLVGLVLGCIHHQHVTTRVYQGSFPPFHLSTDITRECQITNSVK